VVAAERRDDHRPKAGLRGGGENSRSPSTGWPVREICQLASGEETSARAYFTDKLNPAWVRWDTAPRAFAPFPHTVVYSPSGTCRRLLRCSFGGSCMFGPFGIDCIWRAALWIPCRSLLRSLRVSMLPLEPRPCPICRLGTMLLPLLCRPRSDSLYFNGMDQLPLDGLLITGSRPLLVSAPCASGGRTRGHRPSPNLAMR